MSSQHHARKATGKIKIYERFMEAIAEKGAVLRVFEINVTGYCRNDNQPQIGN